MNETKGPAIPTTIRYKPIGILRSEHRELSHIPIQPVYASGCKGEVEIFADYEEGLQDLEGFSHIYLLYHFHEAKTTRLTVQPFLEDALHGIFATRAPCRPNPIGLSIVRLLERRNNLLLLDEVDILDGTPILDVKPFTSRFDNRRDTQDGWQEHIAESTAQQRGRRQAMQVSATNAKRNWKDLL